MNNPSAFAKDFLIFKCTAGSHAYGMNTETSDMDERGVFIAPPEFVISCIQKVEQIEDPKHDDVVYELRKFLKLAAACNPNIIELLFTDEGNIKFIDPAFRVFRDYRHIFLSKKARHTFAGYAHAQLHRIKGHHKWIMQPQKEKSPSIIDYCRLIKNGVVITDANQIRELATECFLVETFGTTQFRVFSSPDYFKEKLGFFTADEKQVRPINVHDDVLISKAKYIGFLLINLDQFKKDHRLWKDYWDWKKNRNEQRAELEAKYKFDTKHASHLVRLLRMCEEILTHGKVIVRRPDAAELLAIRNGEFDYEWLIKWAEDMDNKLNTLYETSPLPYSADYKAIDELYREVVFDFWRKRDLFHF